MKGEFLLNYLCKTLLCHGTTPPPALFPTSLWGAKRNARPFPFIHSSWFTFTILASLSDTPIMGTYYAYFQLFDIDT